ncbi:MAG: PcsB-like coiled-coil domain-containing protein [Bacillota bacterium]|uniref:C40 family peptidase n=1 Tax=Cytobacillus firmus TaxID=1399 RepID=UPI00077C9347|nr:C40 family peptidase [Cytobacillus firmus]MEC1895054.1 NlpC/P60 family protein [Cytobacillus firmus]MED1943127.1 NlpC/P60 family protein [Cytobacillus firmus]MED4451150.1 NlpC/P60 family protein [Cytobacillus firmus]MED4769805.1 NlpC/P60 family protein [Cytobacillus firmus]
MTLKKRLLVLNTTIILGLGSAFSIPGVNAESIKKLENQKSQIQQQRSNLQATLAEADKELVTVLKEIAELNTKIAKVEKAIEDNNKLIAETETNIASTKSEVDQLKAEMAVIEERIEKRSAILKQRAQSFQESGGTVAYLDVLLGASSFSDFVDRVGAVTTFVQADKQLLEEQEQDKKAFEEKKAAVEEELAGLTSMMTELKGMQAAMEEQKQQNSSLIQQLKEKENSIADKKAKLQSEDVKYASLIADIEQSIAAQTAPVQDVAYTSASSGSSSAVAGSSSKTKGSAAVSKSKPAAQKSKGSSASAPKPSVNGGSAISIVTTAGNKYIGNSVYVFGGGRNAYDIANGRFDCSGFVHWAFSQAGISVGASTDSLKFAGRQVSASEMRAGDLVFFDTYKRDGHVGIYLGGGKFIGSQSSTGVAIANMSSGYWKTKFNGRVVRIIE